MRTPSQYALAVWFCLIAYASIGRASDLPKIPKLNDSGFLPVIRHEVQQAYSAALAHPLSADASGKLGMVLDAYQQYDSAAPCYERAHQLDGHSFRWVYYLGVLQIHQGKYDRAIVTLREALRLKPDYIPARLKLGESLLATGQLEESSKTFTAILKDAPDSPEAWYGQGRVEAARNKSTAAIDALNRACDLFPAYGVAQYALALAYRKIGQQGNAEPHFRLYHANTTTTPPINDPLLAEVQALNIGVDAHLRRAADFEQQGRLTEAISEEEQAIQVDPANVQANVNLISLEARAGHYDAAEKHFQDVVRLNPNRADAYYNHGVLLFGLGKSAEAEQAFRRALEINPFYAEAHNNLGFLLEKQGRTEEALAEYQTSIQDQPAYRLAHFHIGRILANDGKYDEAIAHFLKTLAPEDQSTPGYLYALAIAYGRKGDRASALKYAHQARDQAVAFHQDQLVASIDKDLRRLEQDENPK